MNDSQIKRCTRCNEVPDVHVDVIHCTRCNVSVIDTASHERLIDTWNAVQDVDKRKQLYGMQE